jgi:hypothetical protein
MRKVSVLLALLALAGCATLPTELAIEKGPQLVPGAAQEVAYYSPSSPAVGATAQEIVSGFLAAGTGPQNDYSIAREYLTESFATRWKPDTQTLIRVGVPLYQSTNDTLQVVQLTVGARVDDQGRYENLDAQQTSLRFQLVEEDGEWRIASAPNLTVVTMPVFSVVFNPLPIYFLNGSSTQLVPDVRWFPTRTSTPTRLVNALLAGPAPWMDQIVSSAIPTGTGLTVNAVRVEGGVALVDFDANALEADGRQRSLMLAQLLSTLRQLAGVSNVALSVNGAVQEIDAADISAGLTQSSSFALTRTSVLRLSGSEAGPIPTASDWVQLLEPTLLAVDHEGQNVAMANAQRVVWLETSALGTMERDLELATPIRNLQFDRESNLYLYPQLATDPIAVHSADGSSHSLSLDREGEIIDAEVSPEGARLAVVIRSEDQDRIEIFGIRRGSNGDPTTLVEGISFEPVLGDVISVSWNELTNLRVLERTSSGLTALSEYPITGPRQQLNLPPVVGAKLEPGSILISSYLLTDTGEVWVLTSNTWRRIQGGAVDISTGR